MIETIGNWRVVKKLGQGGMGVVFLAKHLELDKMIAIKSLGDKCTNVPEFQKWLFEEANNQAKLEHPNIVQVIDYHYEHGQYFLLMEYVDGQDLEKIIQQKRRLGEKEALSIFKEVLAGLGLAHRNAIIHLDIKPSNIMVGKDGRARVMDFGLAVLASKMHSTEGQAAGGISPWFASPEQIKRRNQTKEEAPIRIDHRSDIYSLGIVLFEMLTGQVPFDGEPNSVSDRQVNEPIPDPRKINPDIPKKLSQIVLKCLAKDPNGRFQGCDELLKTIIDYETPWPTWLYVAATFVMACAISVYFLLANQEPPTPDDRVALLLKSTAEKTSSSCHKKDEFIVVDSLVKQLKHRPELFIAYEGRQKQKQKIQQGIQKTTGEINSEILEIRKLRGSYNGEEFENLIASELEVFQKLFPDKNNINFRKLKEYYIHENLIYGPEEFGEVLCSDRH